MAGVSATGRLLKEIEDAISNLVESTKQPSLPTKDRRDLAEAAERLANARREIAQS